MKVIETDLPGCLVIKPRVFGDARGFFMEVWNHERYADLGIASSFVQSNLSRSSEGVLRGLHYQWPKPQGKLVSVLEGEIYDAVVDIRRDSPTFGQWTAVVLSGTNNRQLWVPEGFAHGFAVLSQSALVSYLCTAVYDPDADAGLLWSDPAIGIDWPVRSPVISAKDAAAPRLCETSEERLPVLNVSRCASC